MTDVDAAPSALTCARILVEDEWLTDHCLIIQNGLISEVLPVAALPNGMATENLARGMLIPGFIDTQVNGGGGVLLNDSATVEGIAQIARAHRQFGTTGLLPTLISDDLDVIVAAIKAVDAAIKAGIPGVLGIHIEGPFLNTAKRGIHNADKFRRLDASAINTLSALRNGKTLVTLAPELAPPSMIRALVDHGVIVAAGHSLATYEDMQRAADEGLTGITHLFNAMTPLESRAPGMVGAALDGALVSGIIVDGLHVDPVALRVAYRARGAAGLMLVTDAMPVVGSDLDRFMLGNTEILMRDGGLRSGDGTLAGSCLNMAQSLRNAVSMLGIDVASASAMASTTPAAFLGQSGRRGRIAPGLAADLVHLDDDLEVQAVWIGGQKD